MLKVYIADDSVVVRAKLTEAIEEKGTIKVIGACGDAKQAIAEIREMDPQVVIIDIRMPGGGGLPVLQDIKANNPKRISMILTSFPSPEYREIYLAAGADYFFDKIRDIPSMNETLNKLAIKNGGSHAG
jgi:DNA-binding NarL/FixJ family response regulator